MKSVMVCAFSRDVYHVLTLFSSAKALEDVIQTIKQDTQGDQQLAHLSQVCLKTIFPFIFIYTDNVTSARPTSHCNQCPFIQGY